MTYARRIGTEEWKYRINCKQLPEMSEALVVKEMNWLQKWNENR